ncbi:MAG: hypothetical protein HYX34_02025 [Actinobacteria bacterium]|nr:hypothetical protein [Actinomycetota bacterium]
MNDLSQRDGTSGRPGDEELLAALRAALDEADPVPPWVLEAAKRAPELAALDGELLELLDAEETMAGMRSTGTRDVVFRSASRTVEVFVHDRGAGLALDGQLEPPDAAEVSFERVDTTITASVDRLGHFLLTGVPSGLGRIVVVTGEGRRLPSSWLIW